MDTRSSRRPSGQGDPRFAQYALLARLFDQAFRVPGTNWRFGLDALLGLIPGVGDLIGAAVGAYAILIARQLGAPASIQGRMLVNLGVDALIGAIPIVGDLFDFGFKAHTRNRVLLERWLAQPRPTHRSSAALMVGILIVLLLVVAGALWLAFLGARWLYQAIAT